MKPRLSHLSTLPGISLKAFFENLIFNAISLYESNVEERKQHFALQDFTLTVHDSVDYMTQKL